MPDKAAVAAGLRIDDDSRSTIRRYVVVFMPATVALLGIAIALFRRQSEGKARKGKSDKDDKTDKSNKKKKRSKKSS